MHQISLVEFYMVRHTKVTGVILAGQCGPAPKWITDKDVTHKGQLRVLGRQSIDHVAAALSQVIDDLIVIGNFPLEWDGEYEQYDATDSIAENIKRAIAEAKHDQICFTTCDIPLSTAQGFDYFIRANELKSADLAYSVIPHAQVKAKFPDLEFSHFWLQTVKLAGGNNFWMTKRASEFCLPFIDQVFERRKNPIALAQLFGKSFMLKALLTQLPKFHNLLTLKEVEKQIEALIGHKIRARGILINGYPEMKPDIDNDERYAQIKLDAARLEYNNRHGWPYIHRPIIL